MLLLAIVFILIGILTALYVFSGGNWKSKSFWNQQFNSTVTQGQVIFDVTLGVLMPVLCLIFDPIVFRNQLPYGQSVLNSIKGFGYTSIALGMVALSLWLLLRNHVSWISAFLAGILLYGAFFALLLGIVLLPFGVVGLLAFVGVLGFTPFLSAFVFLRNGVRAYRQANKHLEKKSMLRVSAVLGAALAILIPLLMQSLNLISSVASG